MRRSEKLEVRLHEEEKESLRESARKAGMSVSDFARERLLGQRDQRQALQNTVAPSSGAVAEDGPEPGGLTPPDEKPSSAAALDPQCRNAVYHWKLASGEQCRFCEGAR